MLLSIKYTGGILSREILSWGDFVLGGFCPGGFCQGGFCPDTVFFEVQNFAIVCDDDLITWQNG